MSSVICVVLVAIVVIAVEAFCFKRKIHSEQEKVDALEKEKNSMLEEKQKHLLESVKTHKIQVSYHESQTSVLQGVFARGDRKLCYVIETAWRKGCKFDSWDEFFRFDLWEEAFEECGVSMEFYANRKREFDEILPWDMFDYGIRKDFLIEENKKAHESVTTPNCRQKCAACGAARLNGGKCDAKRQNFL